MIGLGSFGEAGQESSNLILTDEKGQAGIVLDGRRHRPFVRYRDPAGTVRAGLELAPNGDLEFVSFDSEGRSSAGREDRPLNFLWAFVFCALIIGGAAAGVWVAGSLSEVAGAPRTSSGPSFLWFIATAVLVSLGIAALVTFLDRLRNR